MKTKNIIYIIILLFNGFANIPLFSQDIPEYTTAPSSGGILEGCKGLILKPGFSFKADPSKSLTLKTNTAVCSPTQDATSVSNNRNYIVTITPLDETKSVSFDKRTGKISVDRTTSGDVRTQVSVAYFDGLGRPIQTVQRKASPLGKDLVTIQEYDAFGRESNNWLPGLSSANGAFVDFDIVKQSARSTTMNKDQNPFSFPVYEASPLNRVLEQYGPGQDWHTTKDNINDNDRKSVKTKYLTNNSIYPCIYFRVGNDAVIKNNNYSDGQLYVIEVKDEDGNTSYEFKDKLGQVVLTRQINNGEKYDTYYIYDDFGNLRYVLPPSLIDIIGKKSSGTSVGDKAVEMQQFAYIYKYDRRNRCIQKHLPGCDWIYYVYDKADQLIFTQDGEQRTKGEWMFNKYDALGRVVITGIHKTTESHSSLITKCANIVVKEKGPTGYFGYTWNTLPNDLKYPGVTVISVNYYDDYDHFLSQNQNQTFKDQYKYTAEPGYGEIYINPNLGQKTPKGLLTATRLAVFGSDGGTSGFINTTMYYDYRGRIIQTKSNNHLEGSEIEYIAYDFVGNPIKKKQVHSANNKATQTEEYTYIYDHQGRLKETKHQLNNNSTISLAQNTYDELGRLKSSKKANNNTLNTTYAYNVRNWISNIASLHFNQTLSYSYNGDISSMSWVQEGQNRKYDFTYDNLSRLTNAVYSENGAINNRFTTAYTYDKMGNIQTLLRYGKKDVGDSPGSYDIVDNLSMKYIGNQLVNVHDAGVSAPMKISYDFKDYSKDASQTKIEYTYNNNGAMDKDLSRGIGNITYNSLNLPVAMGIASPHIKGRIEYLYSAGGIKLRTIHATDPVTLSIPMAAATAYSMGETKIRTTDYVGNKIYENNVLKRILIDGGYIENDIYHFYITDHLGNNRIVANVNGTIIQQSHYYPFGMMFAENSSNESQPYKYNGKEFDSELGVNQYDYSARYYEPSTGRFTTIDPHAENYFSMSPYVYCGNNPINRIDPTGMDSLYLQSLYKPTPGRTNLDSPNFSYKEIGRYSKGDSGTDVIYANLAEVTVTPTSHTDTYEFGTGVYTDYHGRIKGEAPLENVDFEVYSTLSGVGGITRGVGGVMLRKATARAATKSTLTKSTSNSLVHLGDEALTQGAFNGAEYVAGYEVYGIKGLSGNTFNRNIFYLKNEGKGTNMINFLRTMENEAINSGANKISIYGSTVINPRLLNRSAISRLGYSYEEIGSSIIMQKTLK